MNNDKKLASSKKLACKSHTLFMTENGQHIYEQNG